MRSRSTRAARLSRFLAPDHRRGEIEPAERGGERFRDERRELAGPRGPWTGNARGHGERDLLVVQHGIPARGPAHDVDPRGVERRGVVPTGERLRASETQRGSRPPIRARGEATRARRGPEEQRSIETHLFVAGEDEVWEAKPRTRVPGNHGALPRSGRGRASGLAGTSRAR